MRYLGPSSHQFAPGGEDEGAGARVGWGLFSSKAVDGAGEGGFDTLVADGGEGDEDGAGARGDEDPPGQGRVVGVVAQPAAHEIPGDGRGDEQGNGDEGHELFA